MDDLIKLCDDLEVWLLPSNWAHSYCVGYGIPFPDCDGTQALIQAILLLTKQVQDLQSQIDKLKGPDANW